jgi:hypothetical protein
MRIRALLESGFRELAIGRGLRLLGRRLRFTKWKGSRRVVVDRATTHL